METRHRVLVAAQPAAWPVLRGLLEEVADLVPVHTIRDAMQVLEHDAAGIDLIICTLTFSEHHMLQFLLEVKGNPKTKAIAFLVCRVLVGRLSEALVERMGAVAKQFGAEFLNLPSLPEDEARDALRGMVTRCVSARS